MREENKIISVVTATHNYSQFLPDCLASVRHSILLPFADWQIEHIVVDDGSMDDTDKLLSKDKHIRHYRLQKNVGASAARNYGIRQAKGKYIFVLDADDVILQRSIFNLLGGIVANPDRRWIYGEMLRVDENLKYLAGEDYYGWEFLNCKEMLAAIIKGEHFIQHNSLFEKRLFEEVGGYDEKINMAEDLDLYIRFLLKGYLPVYTSSISHLHRFHGKNASIKHNSEKHKIDLDKLKNKYKNELGNLGI